VVVLLIGFPLALFSAWAFELTPDGVKLEKDVDRNVSIRPVTGKRLDRMIILGLVAVIILMGVERMWFAGTTSTQDEITVSANAPTGKNTESELKSIAVLPFVNMSADADNEYFSDGIAEELLNVLVRVSALQVASRTSSFSYKGKTLPLSQIAKELGVNHILEGSVRKSGNRVKVTAQLIDANSDRHLWSDTYERELDDIFDIQEEISGSIVEALKVTLNVEEASVIQRMQRPTNNPEAYELYLQGRFLWRKRMENNIRASIDLLEKAVKLDPDFAKAYEALAAAWTVLPSWSGADTSECMAKAVIEANNALMLDPSLAEARAIRAHNSAFNRRWLDSLLEFEAAIESEPKNAGVRQWYAEALNEAGYQNAAMDEIEKAYQIDPAAPVINNLYTMIAGAKGENAVAIKHMNEALNAGLTLAWGHALRSLIRTGDWETIERLAYPHMPEKSLARMCVEAHRDSSLYPVIRQNMQEDNLKTGPRQLFLVYCNAMVGNYEQAFNHLDRLLKDDPTNMNMVWHRETPIVTLRQSPRFKQLLNDIGLVDLYKVRGWPDLCKMTDNGEIVCN